jgi:hypothetical protein
MDTYTVRGPYLVPSVKKNSGSKFISKPTKSIWTELGADDLKKKHGCYIFGIRSAKGIVPYYVGKATKTFEKESFTNDKLQKYNDALTEFKKGNPVIFFIVQPSTKWSKKEIADIEKFLVPIAYSKNPEIKNTYLVAKKTWSIKNVVSGDKSHKKPNLSEQKFRAMMGIVKKMK